MALSTIYTDADNTLWDTNRIYASAQRALLDEVEVFAKEQTSAADRLALVREYDQAIASIHHDHLRYPPDLLAHSLVLGLRGVPSSQAARRVLREGALPGTQHAVATFRSLLQQSPALLPGVRDGLQLSVDRGNFIYVVTEGPKERIVQTLQQHEIATYVDNVLSASKTTSLYRRLRKLGGDSPAAMVGDQLDRDILPAREAGLRAVWVPSAFGPKWNLDPPSTASFVAENFLDAISWLTDQDTEQLARTRRLGPH